MQTITQRTYKLNHSELRGLARYAPDRDKALRDICKDRQHWEGDKYSKPASGGAIAALRAIRMRGTIDLLGFRARSHALFSESKTARAALSRCIVFSVRAYPANHP